MVAGSIPAAQTKKKRSVMTYIPYSEYPFWLLEKWKEKASEDGDSQLVLTLQKAIDFNKDERLWSLRKRPESHYITY